MIQLGQIRMFLVNVANFVRWRDWGPSKIPIFCTLLAYIGLAKHDYSPRFIVDFILYLIFAAVHSALGYVANNFSDREIDELQGKDNPFQKLSQSKGATVILGLLAVAFLSGLPFLYKLHFWWLWSLWAFFALSYSMRPIRLKERGKWGLAVSAGAQWTLPVLLTFAAMDKFGKLDMVPFIFANTISGAALEVAHQRWDRSRDRQTKTTTFGARTDMEQLDCIYLVALLMDKIAIGVVVGTIAFGITWIFLGLGAVIPGMPLMVSYAVLLVLALREVAMQQKHNGQILDPYYSSEKSVNKLLHETFPNFIIPAYLLLLAAIVQPINVVLLVVFLYWRIVLGRADWRWPLRVLRSCFLK